MSPRRSRDRGTHVRLHLTLAGWLFMGVAVLVGLAAGRSKAPLTFVLFGGMLGAVCVSGVLARRMVAWVVLDREFPDRVWQNQTAYLSYYLRNRRRRGSSLGLKVEELGLKTVDFAPGYCLHLEGRSVFRAGARLAARRRGHARLKRIRLSTCFPFGLVRASRIFQRHADIMVWPARGRLKRQMLHRGAVQISSAAPATVQGGQDEFFGLREYRSGDNPRWIHWRRSATREVPVLREMTQPLPEILWVVLDTRLDDASSTEVNTREKMLRFAGTLIDYAFTKGYKVGLGLGYEGGTAIYEPAPGLGQRCKLLDALTNVDVNMTRTLQSTLERLTPNMLRDAQVIVLAPDPDRLSSSVLTPVRTVGSSLSVVCGDGLGSFFEDDPLSEQEAT